MTALQKSRVMKKLILYQATTTKPVINNNYFGEKFQKINQTNINFSVALDSLYTYKLLAKLFNIESNDLNRNLILNIDASSNLISVNGWLIIIF